jgi:hypothetical protein
MHHLSQCCEMAKIKESLYVINVGCMRQVPTTIGYNFRITAVVQEDENWKVDLHFI